MMVRWIQAYGLQHRAVRIRAAPTGSGAGIRAALSGDADIGASDAFLNDDQIRGRLQNIPLAVSAQEIAYNIPELRDGPPLRLSGPILAGIYAGSIVSWDDRPIVEANPGRNIPHHAILPVHRSDGAGDTFLFTQYLSRSDPAWEQSVHFGTEVQWPNTPRSLTGVGNAGVLDTAARARYSVAYLGISFDARARAAGLATAAIANADGSFVLPTNDAIAATLRVAKELPSDGRLSLVYLRGPAAYPIVNFEYAIVKTTQRVPGHAAALRDFLQWIVAPSGGNDPALLSEVHFLPLPSRARAIALAQIGAIAGP
jgi:phosphate transport system substrate-binding protein